MNFLSAVKSALFRRLSGVKVVADTITHGILAGSSMTGFIQHTNPQRNRRRKTLKAMGRRQYLKATKAGRRAIKVQAQRVAS